ncbi:MAG: hypothetical protein RMJ82_14245 [Gemmatales bacterium]|nr:hypothetical protein [Gemmatales bacterium]
MRTPTPAFIEQRPDKPSADTPAAHRNACGNLLQRRMARACMVKTQESDDTAFCSCDE